MEPLYVTVGIQEYIAGNYAEGFQPQLNKLWTFEIYYANNKAKRGNLYSHSGTYHEALDKTVKQVMLEFPLCTLLELTLKP